jgi:ornithine cyclodeaminase/alanine dehydrogenase-like protein (mu-crystallin family)
VTLILARRDIAELMTPADWLEAAETAFAATAEGRAKAPPPMHLEGSGGAFHAKGASLELGGRRYAALKLNGNFPGNRDGLPTIQGAVLLGDGGTGTLLAILDSIELTLRRTAAATALAARFLARPDSATLLVCGCGAQGAAQAQALEAVLPLRRRLAWDRDAERAAALGEPVEDLATAARGANVIVTCTTARTPFLGPDHVRPGTFVAAVGADAPGKSEIEPALAANALLVCDVTDQCEAMGDLRHALAAGTVRRQDVHAELAELVSGAKPGRTDADQITLFDSTGTALQDVAAAAMVFERAAARGIGLPIELGAE